MAYEYQIDADTKKQLLPLFEEAIAAAEHHVKEAAKAYEPFYLTIQRDLEALKSIRNDLRDEDKLKIVDDPNTERSSLMRVHGTFNHFAYLNAGDLTATNNQHTMTAYKAMTKLFEYLERNTFTIC